MKAKRAIRGVNSLSQFLGEAKSLDKLRFDSGAEWGEPQIFHTVRRLIFVYPDPDELDELLGPWEEWFSIPEGIEAIESMRERLIQEKSDADLIETVNMLLEELKEANDGKRLFRLEVR